MSNFGQLVRRLREERVMTRRELADASGSSETTIQRGESEAVCAWKRTTAVAVMEALHARAPLSDADSRLYVDGAGLSPIIAAVKPFIARVKAMDPKRISDDARVHAAHEFVERLIDERGAANVLTALEGIAAAWSVDLPPRDSRSPRRLWTVVTDEVTDDGHRVRTFAPATRQSSSERTGKSVKKKKTG